FYPFCVATPPFFSYTSAPPFAPPPPKTPPRRPPKTPFGPPADSEVYVDAGFGVGAMDHAGHVAVADQADRSAGLPDRRDHVGVAWPVEQDGGNFGRLDAFGPRQVHDVFVGWGVEIDGAFWIAGADCDLLHVAVRRVQQRTGIGHCDGRDRPWHVLGAERCPFQRINRNVDLRAMLGADFFTDEEHRGFVDLALADHHR